MRPFLKLCVGVSLLTLSSVLTPASAAVLPVDVALALRMGAQSGPNQLLAKVREMVERYPSIAQDIVNEAAAYQPSLTNNIVDVANQSLKVAAKAAAKTAALEAAATTSTLSTGAWVGVGVAAAAATAGAVALASGGDDSSSSSPTPSALEFSRSTGLSRIGAASAHAKGGTGSGVKVAVADTGIDTDHPDLVGQFTGGYNAITTGSDIEDDPAGTGHGTFVSGIIAAKKDASGIMGVAYDSQIIPVRIFTTSGTATPAETAAGVAYAQAQGVQVYNGSYGYTGVADIAAIQVELDAYKTAIDAGMIMVFAAGNSFVVDPFMPANMPFIRPANDSAGNYINNTSGRDYSSTASKLLAVVATDASGVITSFSNGCGVAAAWCIAAPGEDIRSTTVGGSNGLKDGTSFAAPYVTGAVAVLLDLYPSLTPEQIVTRLLTTANKTGIYANTSLYGQGFLNLNSASSFIYDPYVATGSTTSGQRFTMPQTSVTLASAFGDSLKRGLAGQSLTVFDSFDNATFYTDPSAFVRTASDTNTIDTGARRFGLQDEVVFFGADNSGSLSYRSVETGRTARGPGADGEVSKTEGRFTTSFTEGDSVSFGYMDDPAMGFGLVASGDVTPSTMRAQGAFLSPYLGFASDGMSVTSATKLEGYGTVRAGFFSGDAENSENKTSGVVAEFGASPFDGASLNVQLGMMTEENTFLGSETSGAFAAGATNTTFGGLSGKLALGQKTDLVGSFFLGMTSAEAAPNSMFTGFSGLQSDAFSLGVIRRDVGYEGARLGLTLNQPLRVSGGSADVRLASGANQAGDIFYSSQQVNLAPSGREIDLEAFYAAPLSEKTSLNTSVMYRHQPNHVANADPEAQALVRVQHRY